MKNMNLDKLVKQYILDGVDGSGYDRDPQTDADKVRFLRETFYAEYGWQVAKLGEVAALREWFAGLPLACNTAFYNDDIIALAIKWGSINAEPTDTQSQKILDNWFNLLAVKTSQLFRKFKEEAAA